MYDKVKAYMKENNMIQPGDTVLAGVSGGRDSAAMLSMLVSYRRECVFDLHVVHVHHGIRGAEADRDCDFVQEMCQKLQVPCQVYRYQVPQLARSWKTGEEEAGRMVRREAFQKEWKKLGIPYEKVRIALAHNQGDLAETIVHNLARGTGLRGLTAMEPSKGNIIRPVLCLSREEIVHYLEDQGIPSIEDSTNCLDDYTRNRIRHHILPLMEQEVNEKAAAHMAQTARLLGKIESFMTGQGRELLNTCRDGTGYLFSDPFFQKDEALQAYAILEAFESLAGRRKDFTAGHVEQVAALYTRQVGKKVMLPYELEAKRTYEGVYLSVACRDGTEALEKEGVWELPVEGRLECPFGTFFTKIFAYQGQKIEEKMYTKWLDYDKMYYNLCIRTRRQGDFLIVNNKGNKKKLNRCLIDEKVPYDLRDKIPLLACDQEILWIVGGRISESVKITSETRRILEVTYQGGKEQ